VIAQLEAPDEEVKKVVSYAASLMENSVENLIIRYNRARGYYRGLKIEKDP